MSKTLDQMTAEELGKIFPIILSTYKKQWSELFITEKELIYRHIGRHSVVRIEHIGSTAVPDIICKSTIDILLEVKKNTENQSVINSLKLIGYLYIPKPENPPPHMMFVKGYTIEGFKGQAYHIHVRYAGDWDELYFRDYLRNNADVRKRYGELKRNLAVKFRNDRDGYTDAKSDFIQKITGLARQMKKT